jgi:hypothetical protein
MLKKMNGEVLNGKNLTKVFENMHNILPQENDFEFSIVATIFIGPKRIHS